MRYLLDPEEDHGMAAEFLDAVLDGLPETTEFDEDTYDLSNVRVNEQVPIEAGVDTEDPSRGFADLVLDVPNEWFLLIELKFSAAETGTEFYSKASIIGSEVVDNYESGQYYLYLHQHDEPEASSNSFANWTWRSFVTDVLDDFITENTPRYPQRTTAQLHDLRTDLQTITNMNNKISADQEKIALYLEHAEAIESVSGAFEEAWTVYSRTWDNRLAESLNASDLDVERQSGIDYPEVNVVREDSEEGRWILRANGGDWQHVFKYGWYKHEDTFEKLPDRAEGSNDLRIGFYHRMEDNKAKAVQDNILKFNFRNMGSNPSDFSDIFAENFNDRKGAVREALSDTHGALTNNKLTLIEGTYDIPLDEYGGFFEAYTAALQDAFEDLVVESPELIRILTEIFDTSIDEYR